MSGTRGAPQASLSSLIQVTQELTVLIKEELRLLSDHQPREIARLADQKSRLAAIYSREMAELKKQGGLKAAGSGENIRLLKKVTREFQNILEAHGRKLKALKTVSERMIKAIGDEVARQTQKSQAYGANARLDERKAAQTPTTLTLNQTI